MKKRVLAVFLVVALLIPSAITAFAASFKDLSSGHWAYTAVNKLVAEGTINGFTDGTFKPNSTVSRAEFVKMIGKGSVVSNAQYSDVKKSDWFYDYVMTSGLEPVTSFEFKPNQAITRSDVVNLLWKRNGSPVVTEKIPSAITRQSKNTDAVAWAYAREIMMGDDYINLRLDSSLTRAEAAALIIRARENASVSGKDFIDNISDEVYKAVYDSFNLFDDKEYKADANVTNGELAHMVMRLICDEHNPKYANFSYGEDPFEHKYVRSLNVYGKYCIGEDKVNKTYIDETATMEDAVCAVSFALAKTANIYLGFGDKDNYYSDITNPGNETRNKVLTFANKNGLFPYKDGKIKAGEKATLKQITNLIIQADSICGFRNNTVFSEKSYKKPESVRTNINSYPKNADNFAFISKNIPNDIYEKEFMTYAEGENIGIAKAVYDDVRQYSYIYNNMLSIMAKEMNLAGYKVDINFYPSLVINNGDGYTYRVKININTVPDGTKLSTLFAMADNVEDISVKNGMTIFVDIETGGKLDGVFYSPEKTGVNNIVAVK